MFIVYLDKVALVYLYKTCSNWDVDILNTRVYSEGRICIQGR